MGMPISVHVRVGAEEPAVAAAVAAAFDQLRAADRMFSTYRPESQISELNRGLRRLADCDPQVREVLDLCEEARRRTDGYFEAMLPGADGRLGFDPSGLVKGWAVELAGRLLADRAVADFSLNAGGDIVLRSGPGQPPWQVGIEDPADPDRLVGVLPVSGGAVATSGTARRGAHIVDPHTGRPVTAIGSVTVVGPSLTWADVYATAAVAGGARSSVAWLRQQTGYRAFVVGATSDLTVIGDQTSTTGAR